jgi:hypothetical protein
VMQFAVGPNSKRPPVEAIFSNAMAGKEKLTPAEWETARKSASEFAPYIGVKL